MKTLRTLGLARPVMVVLAAAFALYPTMGRAEDSNQGQVRQQVEAGGWKVAYGRMITEAEYYEFTEALAASIGSGEPGPVTAYLGDLAETSVEKMADAAPEIGREELLNFVRQAIVTRGGSITRGRLDVKFGVATYQRYQRIVVDISDGFDWDGFNSRPRYRHEEQRIPLPNWHQPYIGIRLRFEGAQTPRAGGPSTANPQGGFVIPPGQWLEYHYREPDGTPAIFIQVGPVQWINQGNGYRFEFAEIGRGPEQVTLLDRSRGLYYQIRADGRGFWSTGGPWNAHAVGSIQTRR
jgi:hypothetical protein